MFPRGNTLGSITRRNSRGKTKCREIPERLDLNRQSGGMRQARWLAPWKYSAVKPAIYDCISRVVARRFVFDDAEREHFRMFMRMQENFSGCRVLSYCVMSNHFHILLDVPPMTASRRPTCCGACGIPGCGCEIEVVLESGWRRAGC